MVGGFYNCKGQPTGPFPVANAEGAGKGTYSLYTGTTQSINVFYAHLERRVGLCNVVKTAVSLGVHRADGSSLLKAVGKPGSASYQLPADDLPSFTLGSVNVSPMTMAAAYATVAANGIYCKPVAIRAITGIGGAKLPVQSQAATGCMSASVAEAATYILQGVLTSGTATGDSISQGGVGIPAAGKTGTANNFEFAAFGGYTPRLAGYVSMFNPAGPVSHPMIGYASCFRSAGGGQDCPGSVFGANAGPDLADDLRPRRPGPDCRRRSAIPRAATSSARATARTSAGPRRSSTSCRAISADCVGLLSLSGRSHDSRPTQWRSSGAGNRRKRPGSRRRRSASAAQAHACW